MWRPRIRRSFLKKILLFSFGLRFLTHLFAAFFPVFLPEVWRQMDTMGVSLRYFLKFTVEPGSFWIKLLPSVLQSGDTSGIMPMEFPLLNLLFAPFWALGPEAGRVAVYLTLTLVVYGLTYFLFRISRGWYRWGFLLFPTVSYATDYYAKFMPDTLSFLLVLLGLVIPDSKIKKNSRLRPFAPILITLGILMKPPAAVGLLFYFAMKKNFNRTGIQFFLKRYTVPVLIGALYYTLGLKLLTHFTDGPALFSTAIKNPFESWFALAKNYPAVWGQLSDRPFFYGGTPLVLIAVAIRFRQMQNLFLIWIAQFLAIAALDGEHSFTHDYYYVCLTPTCCALMVYALFVFRKHGLGFLVLFALIFRPLELSTKDLMRAWRGGQDSLAKECSELHEKMSDFPWKTGYVFRSTSEYFPSLGLCFGERQGSRTSHFGFYYRDEHASYEGCKVVAQTQRLVLTDCR